MSETVLDPEKRKRSRQGHQPRFHILITSSIVQLKDSEDTCTQGTLSGEVYCSGRGSRKGDSYLKGKDLRNFTKGEYKFTASRKRKGRSCSLLNYFDIRPGNQIDETKSDEIYTEWTTEKERGEPFTNGDDDTLSPWSVTGPQ